MGIFDFFPTLKPIGVKSPAAAVFKNGWMEVNLVFLANAILCAKWANTGITDGYDEILLGAVTAGEFYFGWKYTQVGLYKPLVALALAPALAVASQFV